MHPARTLLVTCLIAATGSLLLHAQAPLDDKAVALRAWEGMRALDRYLESWNSQDPALWSKSLHYPHVRPGAGRFEVSRTPEEYAAGVNFEQTRSTGWHHSEWVSRDVLQVGPSKVHIAGSWERFNAEGRAQTSSAITYIVTDVGGHWGVLARFAAGTGTIDAATEAKNAAAGRAAVTEFFRAWNSHDSEQVASAIHYPQVRIADDRVDVWHTKAEFLASAEPGRQRTWYQTRLDDMKVAQTTSNGVNLAVKFSRLGRDGKVLSTDEGIFLVVLRDGAWKVQARSLMGT
ncbi:MAG TPA: hypothetical protein VG273_01700 [Bryobacteraceae bacterium]|jgi:hypothetical protein|nr:hypothetical protein [Bryobacteraceae bacterium]